VSAILNTVNCVRCKEVACFHSHTAGTAYFVGSYRSVADFTRKLPNTYSVLKLISLVMILFSK